MVRNISDWVLVAGVASGEFSTVLVASELGALDNLVPDDHFIALVGIGSVFQDKIQVELLRIPVKERTEVGLQVKADISQSSWLAHVWVFNPAVKGYFSDFKINIVGLGVTEEDEI